MLTPPVADARIIAKNVSKNRILLLFPNYQGASARRIRCQVGKIYSLIEFDHRGVVMRGGSYIQNLRNFLCSAHCSRASRCASRCSCSASRFSRMRSNHELGITSDCRATFFCARALAPARGIALCQQFNVARTSHARPLHPAALVSVPFGIVLVRVRVA